MSSKSTSKETRTNNPVTSISNSAKTSANNSSKVGSTTAGANIMNERTALSAKSGNTSSTAKAGTGTSAAKAATGNNAVKAGSSAKDSTTGLKKNENEASNSTASTAKAGTGASTVKAGTKLSTAKAGTGNKSSTTRDDMVIDDTDDDFVNEINDDDDVSVTYKGNKRAREEQLSDTSSEYSDTSSDTDNNKEDAKYGSAVFHIAKSPRLTNLHAITIQQFWEERKRYERSCVAHHTIQESLKSVIDDAILTSLKMIELKRMNGTTTDEKLRAFFKEKAKESREAYEVDLKEILRKVSIDYKRPAGKERILTFLADIIKVLKDNNVWNARKNKGTLQTIIDHLIEKINDPPVKGLMLEYVKSHKKFKTLTDFMDQLNKFELMNDKIQKGKKYITEVTALRQEKAMKFEENNSRRYERSNNNRSYERSGRNNYNRKYDSYMNNKMNDKTNASKAVLFGKSFSNSNRSPNNNSNKASHNNTDDNRPRKRSKYSEMNICFRCGKSGHHSKECKASDNEAAEYKANYASRKLINTDNSHKVPAIINKNSAYFVLFDSGSINGCYIGFQLVPALLADGCKIVDKVRNIITLAEGSTVETLGNLLIPSITIYKIKLMDVLCMILPGKQENIILGTNVFQGLNINLKDILISLNDITINMNNHGKESLPSLIGNTIVQELGHEEHETIALYFGEYLTLPSCQHLYQEWSLFSDYEKAIIRSFHNNVLLSLWDTTYNNKPINTKPTTVKLIGEYKPFKSRNIKFSEKEIAFLDTLIRELIKADCIRVCNDAPCSCPAIVISDDKGNPKRLVTDLKQANLRCEKIFWKMPDIEIELNKASAKSWFTVLDLAKGYWQYPLDDEGGRLLAFHTHNCVYAYRRLPQGYTNSVFIFQSLILQIMQKLGIESQVIIWIDDILIPSDTIEQHIEILVKILEEFKFMNIRINWTKSQFFRRKVKYLGRTITKEGISFDQDKVITLTNIPTPNYASDLMAFINACGFMRSVIPNFAMISSPLHNLLEDLMKESGRRTKKSLSKIELNAYWSNDCNKAFNQIKEILSKHLSLGFYKPDYDLFVFADASDIGYGLLLTQSPTDERKRSLLERTHIPIACWSGIFKGSEKGWDICSKELYPFLIALNKFHYLLHRNIPFFLVTDNRNLSHIISPDGYLSIDKPLTRNRVYRWGLAFSTYRYKVLLIEGNHNYFCDMISRWGNPEIMQEKSMMKADVSNHQSNGFDDGKDDKLNGAIQAKNRFYRRAENALLNNINNNVDINLNIIEIDEQNNITRRTSHDELFMKDTIAYVMDSSLDIEYPSREEIVKESPMELNNTLESKILQVPDKKNLRLRIFIIAHMHIGGHYGPRVTIQVIKEKYKWPTLINDITEWCNRCCHCRVAKMTGVIARPWGATIKGLYPNALVTLDYLYLGRHEYEDELKSPYVLVIRDDFSNYTRIHVAESADANHAASKMIEWITLFGPPMVVSSDKGVQFISQIFQSISENYQFKHHVVVSDVHHNLGGAERKNRDILNLFKSILSELHTTTDRWVEVIDIIQFALNNHPSERLDGRTALKCFTMIDSISPFREREFQNELLFANDEDFKKKFLIEIELLQEELNNIIKQVNHNRGVMTERANKLRRKRKGIEIPYFPEGSWVYVYKNERNTQSKLEKGAEGPFQITKKINPYVYMIIDPLTGNEREVHIEHLQLFAKEIDLNDTMKSHIARNSSSGYDLDKILKIEETSNGFEATVTFKGLKEPSLMNANDIWKNKPNVLKNYIKNNGKNSKTIQRLCKHYNITNLLKNNRKRKNMKQ